MATIIFKPTEACNARCIYCDVVNKAAHSSKRMSLDTLAIVFSRIDEYLRARPHETLELIWHGGEPLLLGPDYFAQALALQEKHCARTGGRIRHCVQTNLTLLSPAFLRIFRKLGIGSFGTSYDPVANVRGIGRRRDWHAYNRQFMDGLRLLEREGFSWGIIYVVTRLSLEKPLEIFRFLSNLSPSGGFNFNPVLVYGNDLDHIKISPEEYVEFLGAIFPLWWRRRGELSSVEPFASLVKNLIEGGTSLGCADSGACAYAHLNIVADGSLSHCGRSADWGLLNYGSIFDTTLAECLTNPQRDELRRRNEVLPQTECKDCRFWTICHGGCPLDAWSAAGGFLHKSEWCYAKKGFIERYFEPVARPARGTSANAVTRSETSVPDDRTSAGETAPARRRVATGSATDLHGRWINPIGGLGDTLMISGVLKQFAERTPSQKLNLVERTKYRPLLEGHPAIAQIGDPPPGASFISTNYWDHDDYRVRQQRAYQVLARMFGLALPVEERLYVPWEICHDPQLMRTIPWRSSNVLIAPSSDSPRKQMRLRSWERLVELLEKRGVGVVQAGRMDDRYVRGAYSLLGLTTPRQLISLLPHFDVVVTVDNFIMHAAHLCSVPAVVLWGPTHHRVYGYTGQSHLQATPQCERSGGCIGPGAASAYTTPCPEDRRHCMDSFRPEDIADAVLRWCSRGKVREGSLAARAAAAGPTLPATR